MLSNERLETIQDRWTTLHDTTVRLVDISRMEPCTRETVFMGRIFGLETTCGEIASRLQKLVEYGRYAVYYRSIENILYWLVNQQTQTLIELAYLLVESHPNDPHVLSAGPIPTMEDDMHVQLRDDARAWAIRIGDSVLEERRMRGDDTWYRRMTFAEIVDQCASAPSAWSIFAAMLYLTTDLDTPDSEWYGVWMTKAWGSLDSDVQERMIDQTAQMTTRFLTHCIAKAVERIRNDEVYTSFDEAYATAHIDGLKCSVCDALSFERVRGMDLCRHCSGRETYTYEA